MKKHECAVPRAVGDTLVWQCVRIANNVTSRRKGQEKEERKNKKKRNENILTKFRLFKYV